jgi:hypothetical protein
MNASRRWRSGKKNMDVAGNAIMTIILARWPVVTAASKAAGSLIYIRKGKRRENLFQKW